LLLPAVLVAGTIIRDATGRALIMERMERPHIDRNARPRLRLQQNEASVPGWSSIPPQGAARIAAAAADEVDGVIGATAPARPRRPTRP
jgi:hypothetical protein